MTDTEGRQTLKLEGIVTIRDARKLAALVGESLEETRPVEVETRQLQDVDTSILQLLCSLRRSVPELTFPDPSEAFLTAVDRTQLRRALFRGPESL